MSAEQSTTRKYSHEFALKYGTNPQQQPAAILSLAGAGLPFRVLNGKPGYVNLLDALNAWQLVRELRAALNLPAAASFKHVSPAGAAVAAVPLDAVAARAYETSAVEDGLTPSALAYIRARHADPKSSFGDFAAFSDRVDEATARILQNEVSDGVIAPGYDGSALEILSKKKGGNFIVLEADPNWVPPQMEFREVFGVVFTQRRNETPWSRNVFTDKVVTKRQKVPDEALRDMLLASITAKYTQSNSVVYAKNGQVIGVGAGQQSRVDCVKLAGRKAEVWHLRHHPKVIDLPFKKGLKRVSRVNARIRYIEGDFTTKERAEWEEMFDRVPDPLSEEDKAMFLETLSGVALSSDAFFPFRDNIDQASKRGVEFIAQPGGSVQDDIVTAAADEYGMVMSFTGVRLFHH